MDDIEEYPFMFINSPASLQTLASAELALTLWRDKYRSNPHFSYANVNLFLEKKFSCEEVLDFRVPFRIKAEIDERIGNIREELKNWIDFHSIRNRGLFDEDFHRVFTKCFEHIVVDFSGCIDIKTTAMNILNSPNRFSDVEKYKLACLYCFENQVRRFWPSVSKDARIDVNSNQSEWNISYWNECMRSGKDLTNDSELIKQQITLALRWRGSQIARTEVGDLFESLPVHERRVPLPILFLWYPNRRTAIRSLPLKRKQVEGIFEQDASAVFEILLRNDSHFPYAHRMWVLMKSFILKNTSRLESLLQTLLMMVFHSDEYKSALSYTRCDQINELLLDIWSDTPNRLKTRVANDLMRPRLRYIPFLERTDGIFYSCYGHDMTILVELLKYIQGKQEIWQVYWRGIALRSKPVYLERLMRMCLPSTDDVEIFRHRFRYFDDIFRSLIGEAFYSDLGDYLTICSNDAIQFEELAVKVLGSNIDVILLHDDGKFAKFERFVDEVSSKLKKPADEFKIQMISSVRSLKKLIEVYDACKTRSSSGSDDFIIVMSRVVFGERNLARVKRKLSGHFRNIRINCSQSESYEWLEFLKWCIYTDDGEQISASKESLNIDVIFRIAVNCHICRQGRRDHLEFLDKLLKWYFDNEDSRKDFVLDKIQNHDRELSLFSQKAKYFKNNAVTSVDDRDGIYELLIWVFDGDNEKLRTFCESCDLSPPL